METTKSLYFTCDQVISPRTEHILLPIGTKWVVLLGDRVEHKAVAFLSTL